MVLQQLSGTTLPSAGFDEMYTLIVQSWELLLPQHLNWRGRKREEKGVWFYDVIDKKAQIHPPSVSSGLTQID